MCAHSLDEDGGNGVQVRQQQIDISQIKSKGGLSYLLLVELMAQNDDPSRTDIHHHKPDRNCLYTMYLV